MKSPTAYKDEPCGDMLKHKGFPDELRIFSRTKKIAPGKPEAIFLNWLGN